MIAKLQSVFKERTAALPEGTITLGVGLFTLGAGAYLFLMVAGRAMGDERYAPLGALWTLVFLIPPGFFFPVEQELGRAIASRRARGVGIKPVFRRASIFTFGMTVVLVVLAIIFAHLLNGQLFNDQTWLAVALVLSLISYAFEYLARGFFAGNHALGSYGRLIAGEGLVRLFGGAILAVVGVNTAGPYGIVIALTPFLAVAFVARKKRALLDDGPEAEWKELTSSIGNLIAATALSQILVNTAPLIVKYAATASEQATAGVFVKVVLITRIPVFLFQAVQAVMLPRLTHHATSGNEQGFHKLLRTILGLVAGIGLAGVVGSILFGDLVLQIFGSDSTLPRRDFVLLALGNAFFLLSMTMSQALVSIRRQGSTVVGWAVGVAVFIAFSLRDTPVILRVEMALLFGAAASFATMVALLRRHLRNKEEAFGKSEVPINEELLPL